MESSSQSLFQVYYLSAVEVDRRCGSSVLPWIIEELKLRLETAQDMQLLWITLGPEDIAYVADTGMELQHHPYNDIVRCSVGQDNVSFAYIIHSDKDSRSYCHVFQSLIPDEADIISYRLKHHGICMDSKMEPPILPGNRLATMTRQIKKSHKFTAGRSLSSRRNSIDPSTDTVFPVSYYGSMPYKNTPLQAETVDKYVQCLSASNRPSSADKYKKWQRKKRTSTFTSPKTNTMFRLHSLGSDDVDFEDMDDELPDDYLEADLASKSLSDLDCIETSINPTSSSSPSRSPIVPPALSIHSHDEKGETEETKRPRADSVGQKLHDSVSKRRPWSFRSSKKSNSSLDKLHVTSSPSLKGDAADSPHSLRHYGSDSLNGSMGSLNKVQVDEDSTPPPKKASTAPTKTTPTPAVRVNNLDSSEDEEDVYEEGNNGTEQEEERHSDKESHESDSHFDMVHDLHEISQDPEFSLLGVEGNPKTIRQHFSSTVSANLSISGTKMTVIGIKGISEGHNTEEGEQDEGEGSGFTSLDYRTVVLVEAAVIQVLCCSQGLKSPEYVAFVTRQKGTKSYLLHLIRAPNDKAGTGIVKAFKYAFEYNMSLQIPTYLCDTCPIKQLNAICKELNKRTPSESLLQLKDVIAAAASDSEYNSIAKDYKKQPFENEHNQVIRWATLLREHFHRKQSSHTHHSAEKSKPTKTRPSTAKAKFLHLGKLGESYDNLKDIKIEDKSKSNTDIISSTNVHLTDSATDRLSSPLATASAAILDSQFEQDKSVSAYSEFTKYRTMFPTSNSFPPPNLKDSPSSTNEQSPDFGSPSKDLPSGVTRGHRRSMSWRQQIFESVTPSKQTDVSKRRASLTEMVMETPLNQKLGYSASISENEEYSPATKAKNRWKWAIQQQILLLKLEKENQSVLKEEIRWRKLSYKDPSIDSLVIGKVWSELLEQQANSQSHEELFAAVKMGVPPKMREKVWRLLVSHYHHQHPGEVPMGNYPSSVEAIEFEAYKNLTTEYETVIVADIDRTFPTHPYFMDSEGQEALHRVLHAYAVSDTDCGYCQGLSFVAGIVLMHSPNDIEAFVSLNHLMFLYGFREIYSQNMFVLQTKLYQFSRLLHDQQPNIHAHLEENDVSPFLYAAPWFLTIFSSQFPIPFVARVFDLVFFEGVEAIYKVALSLMKHYQYDILQLDSMETITAFLKSSIPSRVSNDSSEILHSATQIGSLSSKLKTFETEYLVMHELMSTFHMEKKVAMSDTEATNELLRKQNKDLIEQVVMCRGAIMRLESNVTALQNTCTSQQQQLIDQQRRLNRLEKYIMETKQGPSNGSEGEDSSFANDRTLCGSNGPPHRHDPSPPPSLDISSSDDTLPSSSSPDNVTIEDHSSNHNDCIPHNLDPDVPDKSSILVPNGNASVPLSEEANTVDKSLIINEVPPEV